MLTEGFLATLVILACAAGLGLGIADAGGLHRRGGTEAWTTRYGSWSAAGGLGAKVGRVRRRGGQLPAGASASSTGASRRR